MAFTAMLDATPEGRVAKQTSFDTMLEAQAHVAFWLGLFPASLAFALAAPAAPLTHWLVDMAAGSITIDVPPPPDFDAIDQATVDALLLDSGVMRALAQALFQVVNDVRVLKGRGTITAAQFKTFLKGLIR